MDRIVVHRPIDISCRTTCPICGAEALSELELDDPLDGPSETFTIGFHCNANDGHYFDRNVTVTATVEISRPGSNSERHTDTELLEMCQVLLEEECKLPPRAENQCCEGCPGWVLDGGHLEVQRCDDCGRFEDDEMAAEYVFEQLKDRGKLDKLPPGNCHQKHCEACFVSELRFETPGEH